MMAFNIFSEILFFLLCYPKVMIKWLLLSISSMRVLRWHLKQ